MQLMSSGKQTARKLKRAQILLAANAGVSDEDIAASVGVGGSTVYRTKRRFVAMLNAPASNGCSQPKKPAPKWGEPIRSMMPNQPATTGQNLCDEVCPVSS